MKPEKVKSRWRRSSELETGDKATVSMGIDIGESVNMSENLEAVSEAENSSVNVNLMEEVKANLPQYEPLDENLYLFERKRSKRKKEVRRMLCECTLSEEERRRGVMGCQDQCLNRLLMIECGSRCATGEACTNKRFQKRSYAKVAPFKTEKKGWGLKLLENVQMGSFVIEYIGEVLNPQEFKQRVKQYAREKSNHYYFMALKSDEILDATNKGNLSRFINHSCEPNCVTQKWTINGELRIGFFAKKDLEAGEELTFDYQFQRYGREAQKCYCNSKSCTGYIGMSNQILDVNTSKSIKRKKSSEEKKREDLEDLILEEEIEKLSENGGLRNKEETLLLARLMVRAEDIHSRENLLNIILGTTEIACLRLFLDYHGLSLLWSWMVDLTDQKLKTKILQVLTLLPVPNKTVLLDSKVYSIVERWASLQSTVSSCGEIGQSFPINCDKKLKKACDTSDSDTPITSDLEDCSNNNSNVETPIRSDEESRDVPDEDNVANEELIVAANNLLESWKDLNEVFRIPRREPIRPPTKKFPYTKERKGKNMCRHCFNMGAPFCSHFSRFKNNRGSWRNQTRCNFNESKVRSRRFLINAPHQTSTNINSSVLTKEKRRAQFAKIVAEEERKKKALQEQSYLNPDNFNDSNNYQYENSDYYSTNMDSNKYSYDKHANGTSYDPFYYNSNSSINQQVLPPNPILQDNISVQGHSTTDSLNIYEPNALYQPHLSQVPFVGTPVPTSAMLLEGHHIAPSSTTVIGTLPTPPILPVTNDELPVPSNPALHSSLYSSEQNVPNISCSESYSESSMTVQYVPNPEQFINEQSETFFTSQFPSNQLFPIQVNNFKTFVHV